MEIAPWSIGPFVALLLTIAVAPLVAPHWWHRHRNQAVVSIGLSMPALAYLLSLHFAVGAPALAKLGHALMEYVDFIAMLAALYTVAGGIAIRGQFRPTPLVNVGLLALGAVLANLIGTTGASMLLIHPFLRLNRVRQHRAHLPVFFIFLVSNLGGLLTPLGDPPLFLGYLNGVDFFFTLTLWPHWLIANGAVLTIALVWDTLAYRREPDRSQFPPRHGSIAIGGAVNFAFLPGVVAAVLSQSSSLLGEYRMPFPVPALLMAALAAASWWLTPRTVRTHNQFAWAPIVEVAILFFGIFVTMVPALALLARARNDLGIDAAWQYFWLTGGLSAVLDNAPTYMALAALAGGPEATNLAPLAHDNPHLLQAISAGAVFLGALTYIGNGPNFMVKSIAESAGYRMPSFFGYIVFSSAVLLPVFALVTWLFFV